MRPIEHKISPIRRNLRTKEETEPETKSERLYGDLIHLHSDFKSEKIYIFSKGREVILSTGLMKTVHTQVEKHFPSVTSVRHFLVDQSILLLNFKPACQLINDKFKNFHYVNTWFFLL